MLEKLIAVNKGLAHVFPHGNTPFQIMTRLLEECGELAQQVNHFENTGVKRKKHGEPDRAKLAKEVQDVLRCVFQLVEYYGLEEELAASIEKSYQQQKKEGLIEETGHPSTAA
jgi:NTP pyrophosphatase (non-canonical NTP hydrolase)